MSEAVVPYRADTAIEKALVGGDLSQMTPAERLSYYRQVCESIGVNPLTQPFQYITLNGKLTFYATRACAEQLRARHEVSTTIVARERIDDVYVVTARATMPNGRTDESTGAVSIGNLKGDALANALMKAETKAKRRVTLSICGLGWMDETETETVPGARTVAVNMETGEIENGKAHTEEEPAPKRPVAPFARYELAIGGAKTLEDLHAIGEQIGRDGQLSAFERNSLRDKYQQRKADLERAESTLL